MGKRRKMLHRIEFLSLLFGKEIPRGEREKNLPGKGESILPRKGKIIPLPGKGNSPQGNGKRIPSTGKRKIIPPPG
jgi:hypothetical protein